MSPAMLARLQAATAWAMAEVNKNTKDIDIINGLVKHHAATYRTGASTNSLRCAGVSATCTWSKDKGLFKAWRKNATLKIMAENAG